MADYLRPVCAIFLPNTGRFLITRFTQKELKAWYKTLKQPSFAPPDWLIAPTLFTAYGCMGYGSYLIWKDFGGFQGDGVLPLTCYGANLALSWSLSPLLCKTKSLGAGVICMMSILGATIATSVTFKQVNSTAGYFVLPYLGLMCYSNFVKFSMWRNNRDRTD